MEKTNLIYGLRDPRNDVYQYIGKTTVGKKRPLQHLIKSHSSKVNKWVEGLRENWLYPIVDVIEEVDNIDDLIDREKYWINYHYNINPQLLNILSIEKGLQNIRSDEDKKEFNDLYLLITKIPSILRNERLYRNLSQNEMASILGISRSTLSLAENGRNVSFDIIQKYVIELKGIDIISRGRGERSKKSVI